MMRGKLWLVSAGIILCGWIGIEAQSSLSTTYATADAWDCAGGDSCPKPIGSLNGKNAVFTLRAAPTGPAAVDVFLNGLRLRTGGDYVLTTNTAGAYTVLTFFEPPQPTDTIDVRYRENTRANVLPQ
jgi:hypothetical protein